MTDETNNGRTSPDDWDVALGTIDMPADDRAAIAEEKRSALPSRASGEQSEKPVTATASAENAETQNQTANTSANTEAAMASQGETQTDDIFELDPTKEFKLPDGTTLKGSQILQGMSKKADLDKERWQFNKEKEQFQSKLEWLGTAEKTESARILLQLVDSGIPEDEAVRILASRKGIAPEAKQEPSPVSNSIAIDPAEFASRLPVMPEGMRPGSDEANAWYLNVYEPAKLTAIAEITIEAQERRQAERQAKAEAEANRRAQEASKLDQVAAYNDSMIAKAGQMMYEKYGISYDNLDEAQQKDLLSRMDKALQENGLGWVGDDEGKRKNVLRETDIKVIVSEAFPEGRNPYKVPSKPRTNNSQEKPLSAESPVSQVKATGPHGYSPENYASPMEAAMAELASQK